jgi:hypothetical protein
MIRVQAATYASQDELYVLYREGMGETVEAPVVGAEEQERAFLESAPPLTNVCSPRDI